MRKQIIIAAILFTIPVQIIDPKIKVVVDTRKAEISCLAKNIYWEAGNQSTKGKEAVAQVTLNRVASKSFPNNVCSVVYERNKIKKEDGKFKTVCQFSWTCTTKKNKKPPKSKEWVESIKIAENFIKNNHRIKKLEKALYYHADYIIEPNWVDGMIKLSKIGNHIFYSASNI